MDQVIWNHYNSLTRWRNVPIVDSPTQTAISPRLGISHPITERSTIRFFTGRFHQFVGLQSLYNRTWRATGPDNGFEWERADRRAGNFQTRWSIRWPVSLAIST